MTPDDWNRESLRIIERMVLHSSAKMPRGTFTDPQSGITDLVRRVADIEAALEISEVKASAKAYVSLDARLVAMEEENDKLRERLLICEEELNTLRKRCDNEETKRERLEVNVLRMWGTSTMFDRSLEELSKRLALLESFLIDSGQ